jgi:hypothetical protein
MILVGVSGPTQRESANNLPVFTKHEKIGPEFGKFTPNMASTGAYEVHSEARGSHWIAWVSRDGDPKPYRSVVLVGQTQDEAVANARQWAERT